MPDFNKKRNKNLYRHFLIKLGAVIIAVLVLLVVVADVKVYQRRRELSMQVESLQKKIEELKNKNGGLKEGLAKADDDAYIEKIAREELDLQKPGEKVISFVVGDQLVQDDAMQKNGFTTWMASTWNSFVDLFKK